MTATREPRVLAAAQTIAIAGDIDGNVAEHLHSVRAAARAGARVLVFPELSLTGYELALAARLALTPGDPRLAPLAAAAVEHAITLVVGAPLRIGARLHIGALLWTPDGRAAHYTKQRLGAFPPGAACDGIVPPAEAEFFEPGQHDPLLEDGGNTFAIAICADTGRPAHPRAAAERGANAYLASMFVIPSEFERETGLLAGYARQHAFAVVFANHGGPTGGLRSAGRSTIWSETGARIVQLDAAGAGIAIAREERTGWRGERVALPVP